MKQSHIPVLCQREKKSEKFTLNILNKFLNPNDEVDEGTKEGNDKSAKLNGNGAGAWRNCSKDQW